MLVFLVKVVIFFTVMRLSAFLFEVASLRLVKKDPEKIARGIIRIVKKLQIEANNNK